MSKTGEVNEGSKKSPPPRKISKTSPMYLDTFVLSRQVAKRQGRHEAEHRAVVGVGGQHGADRPLRDGGVDQLRQPRAGRVLEVRVADESP